jgi:hypothetical protein
MNAPVDLLSEYKVISKIGAELQNKADVLRESFKPKSPKRESEDNTFSLS